MSMKQIIVIRSDLGMGCGKEIAQGAHAALCAYFDTLDRLGDIGKSYLEEWDEGGSKKVVCLVHSEAELLDLAEKADQENIGHYLVRDHGKTEVPPNTLTAFAIGPDLDSKIDRVTGGLATYREVAVTTNVEQLRRLPKPAAHQVWRNPEGYKRVLTSQWAEKLKAEGTDGWIFVCEHPHGERVGGRLLPDFSYLCLNVHCRCRQ